jgi:cysteine desulfurase
MKRVFFDNAATTPLDPEVIEIMLHAMREDNGNPSSIHEEGRKARAAIEQARRTIAQGLNASIGEIFFTSGGTESNNMALKCAVRDLGVQRIISARTEHHCVLHSLETLHRHHGTKIIFLPQSPDGHIEPEALEMLLKSDSSKTLVSLMHANNEIGTLNDLHLISNLCSTYGALFHSDTVQTIGFYPIDLGDTPIHFLSGSAHKFHGPKGTGFIYINKEHLLHPFIDGGSQERNMRGGTENVPGIVGMARALQLAWEERLAREQHIRSVRDYLAQRLRQEFDDITFNGDPWGSGHYKILSTTFPPSSKADLLLLHLDIAGIAASGGSACSSGADAGSHVINALKNNSPGKTLRFSFSHFNTIEEVDFLISKLKAIGI